MEKVFEMCDLTDAMTWETLLTVKYNDVVALAWNQTIYCCCYCHYFSPTTSCPEDFTVQGTHIQPPSPVQNASFTSGYSPELYGTEPPLHIIRMKYCEATPLYAPSALREGQKNGCPWVTPLQMEEHQIMIRQIINKAFLFFPLF